nr:hypothetical protein [Tanacetum cinerariifolium]
EWHKISSSGAATDPDDSI